MRQETHTRVREKGKRNTLDSDFLDERGWLKYMLVPTRYLRCPERVGVQMSGEGSGIGARGMERVAVRVERSWICSQSSCAGGQGEQEGKGDDREAKEMRGNEKGKADEEILCRPCSWPRGDRRRRLN
jgi:hypothetical protein